MKVPFLSGSLGSSFLQSAKRLLKHAPWSSRRLRWFAAE